MRQVVRIHLAIHCGSGKSARCEISVQAHFGRRRSQPAEDSPVDVTVRNGKLVVVPIVETPFTLEELVNHITPENRHTETEMGRPVGNEIW
jgi:hypothetical protein